MTESTGRLDYYTSPQVAEITGLSFRQVDYIIKRTGMPPKQRPLARSGYPRYWNRTQVERFWIIERLMLAGFHLKAAITYSERLQEQASYSSSSMKIGAVAVGGFMLSWVVGPKDNRWGVPWEKAIVSTQADQDSSQEESTTAESQSSEKTGLPQGCRTPEQAYIVEYTEHAIRTTEKDVLFLGTKGEAPNFGSCGAAPSQETY